jgi:hypothetical protein
MFSNWMIIFKFDLYVELTVEFIIQTFCITENLLQVQKLYVFQ